jgi:hypothetical protein
MIPSINMEITVVISKIYQSKTPIKSTTKNPPTNTSIIKTTNPETPPTNPPPPLT